MERRATRVRIDHSHHCIADLLRELSSPYFFLWCLSPITRIANLGAEGTQPIRLIERVRHRGVDSLQQNEQAGPSSTLIVLTDLTCTRAAQLLAARRAATAVR
jgi:hypothetical protein